MVHSSVARLPPRPACMAGNAVMTTSASSAVMKKATDVSPSAQPAVSGPPTGRADLVSCMSNLRDRAARLPAPANCPSCPCYGGPGLKSTGREKNLAGPAEALSRCLRGPASFSDSPAQRLSQGLVVGLRYGPVPRCRGFVVPAGLVEQVGVRCMQGGIVRELGGGDDAGQYREASQRSVG